MAIVTNPKDLIFSRKYEDKHLRFKQLYSFFVKKSTLQNFRKIGIKLLLIYSFQYFQHLNLTSAFNVDAEVGRHIYWYACLANIAYNCIGFRNKHLGTYQISKSNI